MGRKNLLILIGIIAICFCLLAAMTYDAERIALKKEQNIICTSDAAEQAAICYAYPEPEDILRNGREYRNELVDVRLFIPGIKTEMMYASADNFTGEVLYPVDLCLLQKGTAEKLKLAQKILNEEGMQLLICDAYRPGSVQLRMYEILGDSQYLMNPENGPSNHNRGAAVDVTLLDLEGNAIEMPSDVDTFDDTAHRKYTPANGEPERSAVATENMERLTWAMTECGFTIIQNEWWHFNDSESQEYPATDLDFLEVPVRNKERT